MLLVERRVPDLGIVATAAAASAALLLTRPMLETAEAKAAFAPLAARRWLLLASTAAVTASAALGTLLVELGSMPWHALPSLAQWVGLPLLAASLVASAVGVARMRAWGILLGAVTSVLALAVGAAAHDRMLGLVLASTAVPGATMVGAILAARARASASASRASPGLRIASAPEPAVEPARLRIPTDEDLDVPEIEPARAPERLRA
jgi:hypothetical protein